MDRDTILVKKIAVAALIGQPVDHFAQELLQVNERLAERIGDRLDLAGQQVYRSALSKLNGGIWEAIDNLRASETDADAALWGRQAMRLNDERAAVIADLNHACGVDIGREKVT
jgi:hypothetical protein